MGPLNACHVVDKDSVQQQTDMVPARTALAHKRRSDSTQEWCKERRLGYGMNMMVPSLARLMREEVVLEILPGTGRGAGQEKGGAGMAEKAGKHQ